MARKKKIAKELKRPDQFVDFWTHAWTRAAQVIGPRRKPAIAAAVALAVALVGGVILDRWEGGRSHRASEELARIERMAAAELLPATPTEVKPIDDTPRFKTATERRDAVLRELETFLKDHGRTKLRDSALTMKGSELLSAGRYDDAVATYRSALDGKMDTRLRFMAREGLGYAHEGKGELDKASEAFGALGTDVGGGEAFVGFYKDRAAYQKARITQRKGDKTAAVKLYRDVLEKYPETALHDEITDRLAVLEAE